MGICVLSGAAFAQTAQVYQASSDIVAVNAPEPGIHGPRVVGATPGRPFLFLIPATGDGPLRFAAENLPPGLALNAETGIITGAIEKPGTTVAHLTVTGPRGTAKRELTLIAGTHCLALTPPLGWNSWNIWAREIDDAKMRAAADGMIKSGLAAHGYQYVNLDDTWEGERDANGVIRTNKKFPDMKALADYIHGKGLKFGIYSSPGRKTCANYEGSLGHEEQDARTYAEWGADYLKYDWCSYHAKGVNLEEVQFPFRVMGEALDKVNRDIVYSLSEGGAGNVWEWGSEVGANVWRTTGDIKDTWDSVAGIGFGQAGHEPYAGPGHWNDPDMLVVGEVKWGKGPCHLTRDEQITHITLWSLLAAPLLMGCDLSNPDPFTLALLTNDEVLDVNQDPQGTQASRRAQQGAAAMMQEALKNTFAARLFKGEPGLYGEIWARPLWDGTLAVGVFNTGHVAGPISAAWVALGLSGPQPVRDLWLHKDLGEYNDTFTAQIPSHGAVLLKIGRANAGG
jgi:alpha-galactosidase